MSKLKVKRVQTLLLATLVAGAIGTASAGRPSVAQTAQASAAAESGTFSFVISNPGSVGISDVRVVTTGSAIVGCASSTVQGVPFELSGSLGAGDRVRCAVDVGSIGGPRSHSITVIGQRANGAPFRQTAHATMAPAAVPNQAAAAVLAGGVYNDPDLDNNFAAGETVDYNYTVYNLGNVALSNIVMTRSINAAPGVAVSCPSTTLAVGAEMVCTETYVLPASPPFALNNTVTVNATNPSGAAVATVNDLVLLTGSSGGAASIRAIKSPLFTGDTDGNNYAGPGDVVTYLFALKNIGSQTLNPVDMTEVDPTKIDGTITCEATTVAGNPFTGLGTGELPVGDSVMCSATYTLQASDVGTLVTNDVTLSGIPPAGPSATSAAFSSFSVLAPPPIIAITKALTAESGADAGLAEAGETLTYQITLSNSGGAATAYSVTDVLDPNVTFGSADNGGALTGGDVVWNNLAIPAGGTLVLTVTVTVNVPIPAGVTQIANLAYATGTAPPPCPPAGAQCVVIPVVPQGPPPVPAPVNGWRAMLLLGFGLLLVVGFERRRRKHSSL